MPRNVFLIKNLKKWFLWCTITTFLVNFLEFFLTENTYLFRQNEAQKRIFDQKLNGTHHE